MTSITKKPLLPLLLMTVMATTRFDHFGSALSLPDASLAVFFLAGISVSSLWFFAVLLLEAGIIDYLAIAQFNVSDYCISPAYSFLIPAYAVMWFAGRCGKTANMLNFVDSLKIAGLATLAATIAFAISNGSFYLLSGRIEAFSWTGFATQFIHYYPPYLVSEFCYGLAGLLIIKLFKLMPGAGSTQTAG